MENMRCCLVLTPVAFKLLDEKSLITAQLLKVLN